MQAAIVIVFLSAIVPLARAWFASRGAPLQYSLLWALAAWLGWVGLGSLAALAPDTERLAPRFVALSLTCCAGVSVLGARQPGAAAWNFVVLGLLAVLLLPLAEALLLGGTGLGWVRLVFLTGTLAFIGLNYLPTCFTPVVILFAATMGVELLYAAGWPALLPIAEDVNLLGLALLPWGGWWVWRMRPRPASGFDRLWRDFRNRHGLVWAARLREHFNRAAANAGWPVHLGWQGLQLRHGSAEPGPDDEARAAATLQAMLKRFV